MAGFAGGLGRGVVEGPFEMIKVRRQVIEDLSPFWRGGMCANMAWMTIWPLDVVKSRAQSGKFEGVGMVQLLKDAAKDGHLWRGVGPGLTRSFIANGSSMV
eukprot:319281-Ditylum_brightwellii.AAC.1